MLTRVVGDREVSLRSDDGGDEELRAVGVLAGVSHREEARLGVLELEVLVRELVAVDYLIPPLVWFILLNWTSTAM